MRDINVPYRGPTDTSRHRKKCCHHGDLAPGMCTSGYVYDVSTYCQIPSSNDALSTDSKSKGKGIFTWQPPDYFICLYLVAGSVWYQHLPEGTFENRCKASIRNTFCHDWGSNGGLCEYKLVLLLLESTCSLPACWSPCNVFVFCDRGYRYARVMTAPPFTIVCRLFNLHLLVLLLLVAPQDTSCQTTQIATKHVRAHTYDIRQTPKRGHGKVSIHGRLLTLHQLWRLCYRNVKLSLGKPWRHLRGWRYRSTHA